ncbi:MAG TPA: hypothetical protein VK794_03525 [Steroidobacteraceae bacterium]|jgi:hypothetical protein|nr:hypothetical protein [Steroidobacteraceae bacterium]
MSNRFMDGDAAAEMLERRWFAAFKAASCARAECEALIEAMAAAETAWADARERLAKLESLRDALGEELAELDGRPQSMPVVSRGEVRSAA